MVLAAVYVLLVAKFAFGVSVPGDVAIPGEEVVSVTERGVLSRIPSGQLPARG